MPAHEEILQTVIRVAGKRPDWSFTPDEIVRALPHLNRSTVLTHVTSRCCINAPKNHPHKWDYFTRVGRGRYTLAPQRRPAKPSSPAKGMTSKVRESRASYEVTPAGAVVHTVHAAIREADGWYSAECLEIAVVTQGRTLDQTVANLRDAIALHLEDEDAASLGLGTPLGLQVTFESRLP